MTASYAASLFPAASFMRETYAEYASLPSGSERLLTVTSDPKLSFKSEARSSVHLVPSRAPAPVPKVSPTISMETGSEAVSLLNKLLLFASATLRLTDDSSTVSG